MRFKQAMAVGTAVLFLATTASTVVAGGTWLAGGGAFEPSTSYDTPAYMFQTANTDLDPVTGKGVEKLYLNAYLLHFVGYLGGVPYDGNVDGGNVVSPYGNMLAALLGYWRDCNGDGYIGSKYSPSAYGSFASYPAQASLTPIDPDVCPVGSPYRPINPATGEPDGLVDEFRHIGPGAGCDPDEVGCWSNPTQPRNLCVPPNQNPPTNTGLCPALRTVITDGAINDVSDPDARVWGDWERPGYPHVPHGPLTPLPRGTFSDSAGTLQFVDDATVRTLSSTVPGWNSIPNIGTCNEPNPTFLGGPTGTCGLYPLYQVKRLQNDTSCTSPNPAQGRPNGCEEPDALVTTWDLETDDDGDGTPCNDAVNQPVNRPDDNSRVARVALPDFAPGVNPNLLADGSLSGTLEHQQRATNATTVGGGTAAQECGRSGGIGDQLERDFSDSQVRHSAPTFVMNFSAETRHQHLAAVGFMEFPVEEYGNLGGGTAGLVNQNAGWYHNIWWTTRPPRTGWGYTATTWSTFYADIGAESFNTSGADPAVAIPSGGQDRFTYGAEFCANGFTTGATSNVDAATRWECNIDEWERTRLQYNDNNRLRWAPGLNDPYDVRDVDCYDNEVSSQSSFWGTNLAGIRLGVAACP